jgi:nucleoside-diphosphate-sugar epimerase
LSICVVTGGAGFIGSHLVLHLARAGHNVRILDDLSGTGSSERADTLANLPNVSLCEGDIRDASTCRKVCAGAEIVFHEAAEPSVVRSIEDPSTCVDINVGGTVKILRAATASGTVRRFVYASTCAIYGDSVDSAKKETTAADPLSPYATSKLAGEYFCQNFFRLYNLQTVVLRYFNVYGAGQDPNGAYAAVIPRFLTNIVRKQPLIIFGDGEQSRDFVHVQDIVDANLKAALTTADVGGKVLNIGSGRGTTLNELVEQLKQISEPCLSVDKLDPRPGDIRHSRADISEAASLLQFSPSVTLEAGLARTLQYFKSSVASLK